AFGCRNRGYCAGPHPSPPFQGAEEFDPMFLTFAPSVVTVILLVLIVVAAAIGGLALVRHLVPSKTLERFHEVAGFIIAVVGVLYAVLLAMVVIAVWERYEGAESGTFVEADQIIGLYHDAGLLPAGSGATIVDL